MINWNELIKQVTEQPSYIIGVFIILGSISLFFYWIYRKIEKSNGGNITITTKDIDSKGDVIIGKGNLKNK